MLRSDELSLRDMTRDSSSVKFWFSRGEAEDEMFEDGSGGEAELNLYL